MFNTSFLLTQYGERETDGQQVNIRYLQYARYCSKHLTFSNLLSLKKKKMPIK